MHVALGTYSVHHPASQTLVIQATAQIARGNKRTMYAMVTIMWLNIIQCERSGVCAVMCGVSVLAD